MLKTKFKVSWQIILKFISKLLVDVSSLCLSRKNVSILLFGALFVQFGINPNMFRMRKVINMYENVRRLRKKDQQLKGLQHKREEQSDARNPHTG